MPPAADRDVQPRGGRAARAPARPHRDRAVGRRAVDVWRPRQGHRGGDALPGQLGYGHQREQGDDRRAVHERHPGARVPQGRARGAGAGQVPGGGGAPRWRAGPPRRAVCRQSGQGVRRARRPRGAEQGGPSPGCQARDPASRDPRHGPAAARGAAAAAASAAFSAFFNFFRSFCSRSSPSAPPPSSLAIFLRSFAASAPSAGASPAVAMAASPTMQ
mmetsp:Transcript_14612/g.42757  ORF Transcript_14612/g.42757 Transcript_14612/m.42757 type:complete len:217 (+) Transcript_14612:977-1627(+)